MAGDGSFTERCQRWLADFTGARAALLTHSCTAALEMAAILIGIEPGDEVIMPSYTFVSTANAVVLRGAVPVFVDIRPDTLNIDEEPSRRPSLDAPRRSYRALRRRAGRDGPHQQVAARHDLIVVEDAAQASWPTYKGRGPWEPSVIWLRSAFTRPRTSSGVRAAPSDQQ